MVPGSGCQQGVAGAGEQRQVPGRQLLTGHSWRLAYVGSWLASCNLAGKYVAPVDAFSGYSKNVNLAAVLFDLLSECYSAANVDLKQCCLLAMV